jgi:peptidoglycan/LPS O-acetylase OafA/YrhL
MPEVISTDAFSVGGNAGSQRLLGLDGLRAVAAAMVLIPHTEHILANLGLPHHLTDHPWLSGLARLGVVLFFVLSGFIITYRLCMEQQQQGGHSIPRFYMRRILRIWPVYFLVVILALGPLAGLPIFQPPGYDAAGLQSELAGKVALYVLMLPSLVPLLTGLLPTLAHLWSIGTEEQFYLFWPWLLSWSKRRMWIPMLLTIIVYILVDDVLRSDAGTGHPLKPVLFTFWYHFRIDHLALGGLIALVLVRGGRPVRWLGHPTSLAGALLLVVLLIRGTIVPPVDTERTLATLFGLVILSAARGNIPVLDMRWLRYLGSISYGIYMYHVLVAVAVVNGLHPYTSSPIVLLVAVVISVIAVAALSYHTFETYFLRLKQRYA